MKKVLKERFAFVDILKILSIFLVVLFHILYEFNQNNALRPIGLVGVSLFFIISGFTLAKRYAYLESFSLKWFLKRYFKVSSVYYIAIIVIAVLFAIQTYPGKLLNNLFVHFFFLDYFFPQYQYSIISPAWFLVPLMGLYILFPYLNRFVKKYDWFIVVPFLIALIYRIYAGTFTSYSPLFFIADFCFGIYLAHHKKNLILFVLPFLFLMAKPVMVIPFFIFLSLSYFNSWKSDSWAGLFLSENIILIFLFHESFMKVLFGKWEIYGLGIGISLIILIFATFLAWLISKTIQKNWAIINFKTSLLIVVLSAISLMAE